MRGFSQIWLIIVTLIIVVAGGAYYLGRSTSSKPSANPVVTSSSTPSPTPLSTENSIKVADETANWKTYTNTIYRFSIKYPDNWYGEAMDKVRETVLTPNSPCIDCGGVSDGIFISVKENQSGLTSKEYLDQVVKPAQGSCGDIKIINNPILFKDADILIVEGFCGAGAPGPEAIISKNNHIIILSSELSSAIGSYIGVNHDTVIKIFSAFKFL